MLWVELLNRGLGWDQADSVRREFGLGAEIWGEAEQARFSTDLGVLRRTYAASAMGGPLAAAESSQLDQWLATVTVHPAPAGSWAGLGLPHLVASRPASPLPAPIEQLLTTALVELLASGEAARAVVRCRGLVRGAGALPYEPADDAAFARQAGLAAFVAAGWRQCPQLVHAPRGAQYCSKACSNAAFAARKAGREPRYFATKQAHYRERQQHRHEPRRSPGPFAFVD